MLDYKDFKDRVTRLEDGTWCWRCPVDDSTAEFSYRLTLGVCGGICALLILMAMFMDPWALKITLLSCLGVMAVAAGVVLIFKKLGAWDEFYWMNDEYIRIGTGKSTRVMEYDKLKRVVLTPEKIRLEAKFGKGIVFIPDGDYEMVRDYILRRIPETTEVIKEGP
ncbi:hypothetical protein SAMN04487833_1034 [Sarcina sp. DSM 11001]|uniref:hypothetical protein n=1 Tax=Sarcina sp. DSM 11001 TaxID=1798184 RepID=UPI0008894928|nr:hypothetical protein [Sarcina sp. DSM 11001]SDK43720.1 hypothetical protein SAMN04487833_1034 [Sarcina sp. DSM 11001]